LSRIPEVEAQSAGSRRPLTRLLIGSFLILPALTLSLLPEDAGSRAATEAMVAEGTLPQPEIAAVRSAVQDAWRAKVLERQRERLSLRFADRFRIPLDLAHEIHLAAIRERVDPEIAFKLVRAESGFRARAVSPVGAMGLTQLMPETASWLVPGTHPGQLFDVRTNLRVGFRYLRRLLDQYGDPHLALTAYNRGPGTVNRMLRRGSDPDNGYTDFVFTGDASRHITLLKRRSVESGLQAGS
jgi:soluble lytic murein transglycosylase-like protein